MAIETLNVSLSFIALCAGSLFVFGAWIGPLRGKLGVLRGDGGDPDLFKRSRIHGNFVENAPLVGMVMLAAELLGLGELWLWLAVGSFFAGRAYHYVRYDEKDRGIGALLTTGPALAMGIFVLAQVL
jgi:uncharacterized membrane protein YecN with MAPEG domain